jgi:DNA-binding transcriptional LysR family regulator
VFDPITLDQLRALLTVADEGSFSAAARRLGRVQSAISTAMANLEEQLGVVLWDRSGRTAKLTPEGQAVLAAARRVILEVDALRQLANGMEGGVEAQVALCVDALFPLPALVDVCARFAKEFPLVDLRVYTEVMSAVSERVLKGSATLGVVSPLGFAPGLERQMLAPIRMLPVVGREHPLAQHRGPIPTAVLASAVQIVLSERGERGVADQAVLSPRTWRVGDLHTKHALLRAGLGWGNLPEHLVREEVERGELVTISPAAWGGEPSVLTLSAIYREGASFGPAHRWLLGELRVACSRPDGREAPVRARSAKRVAAAPPKKSHKARS